MRRPRFWLVLAGLGVALAASGFLWGLGSPTAWRGVPALSPMEAALFPGPNSLDQAPAFRGGHGFRGEYPLVEMDLTRLVVEQVYPPTQARPPLPALPTAQAPAGPPLQIQSSGTPGTSAAFAANPGQPMPQGHRLISAVLLGGRTFIVSTDANDIWVHDAARPGSPYRIKCDPAYHGLSESYRKQVAAFARGDRLVVAYSFENSRLVKGELLDLGLNKIREWTFTPQPQGPNLPNRAHLLHVPLGEQDFLLTLRADGGLWLLRADDGELADSLDIGTGISHAKSVQMLWHPRNLVFALALVEDGDKRGGLFSGRVEAGASPKLRLLSQARMMKNVQVKMFAATLGDAGREAGSQLALMGGKVFLHRQEGGWREQAHLPLPRDIGRLGDHEFGVLLPGGAVEVWKAEEGASAEVTRRAVRPAPALDNDALVQPNWGDLQDGFNPDIMTPSFFLPSGKGLLLAQAGPRVMRLDREGLRPVPEEVEPRELHSDSFFLPASLRYHPASGWWWMASVGQTLTLAHRDVPLARALILLNLCQGRLTEVWRETARQSRFHHSQDNLNQLAMSMFIFGDAQAATVCFASEGGVNLVDSESGQARLWEAPFRLRPEDQEWVRGLRPIFGKGGQAGAPPQYIALWDSAWLSGQDLGSRVLIFESRGRVAREMGTPFPLWLPAWRDVSGDGFPDLVAKSTGKLAMLDLRQGRVISYQAVDGACYGGLPVDMERGDILFLGDNTPSRWSAGGEPRWVGSLSSDGFNRLGAFVRRQGAIYLWQPAFSGEYLVFDEAGRVTHQSQTGFSDLGRHSLSLQVATGQGESGVVVGFGRARGRAWLFGLDPLAGAGLFQVGLPPEVGQYNESMPLLLRVDGRPGIWFLTGDALYRVAAP